MSEIITKTYIDNNVINTTWAVVNANWYVLRCTCREQDRVSELGRALRVYLSEQHKLGKLPRQHEAQVGDAQGDHGRPAGVLLPVIQMEESMSQRSDSVCGGEGA